MHLCNYCLRFVPLMGSTAVAVSNITRVCTYVITIFRFHLWALCSRCFKKNRDFARMQDLIRIHLWALLQSLFSDVTRLCTCNYYLRFQFHLWVLLQTLFSKFTIMHLCNYYLIRIHLWALDSDTLRDLTVARI
ncbi:hypothetical protein CEXT_247371 [Caerostris extrusa]|uniref:Secreted protein n=1 Tax=Caerostris extrusa TaxID=172846 RepID=A0AAV4NME4_CAEEX|nr:hypothetical protein CEXT_247371 [Caerostris extrusa]